MTMTLYVFGVRRPATSVSCVATRISRRSPRVGSAAARGAEFTIPGRSVESGDWAKWRSGMSEEQKAAAAARLAFADLRSIDRVNTLREQFSACGLTVEKQTDITTNVLTALQLDNARKLQLIDAWIQRIFHQPFRVFAGIAGTRNYAGLESGKIHYLSAQLAKSSPEQAC